MGDFGAPRKVLPTHYERFRTQLTYFHDFFFILKFSLEPSSQKACISPIANGKPLFFGLKVSFTDCKFYEFVDKYVLGSQST